MQNVEKNKIVKTNKISHFYVYTINIKNAHFRPFQNIFTHLETTLHSEQSCSYIHWFANLNYIITKSQIQICILKVKY